MNHEYIHIFRWLRDDYIRLRDGTELLERINECFANTECKSQGSCTEQRNLSSLKSHDYPINSKSTSSLGAFFSSDSISTGQGKAKEGSDNSTIQDESRRPRKGHKKSRRGCYNCKKRKVKCQETLPSCQNCTRNHLSCCYPKPPPFTKPLKPRQIPGSSPVPYINLQATPTIFSLDDMFLFHHFLMYAHPYLPVGSKEKWVCYVPILAHHNSFLLHSMLALSASHLSHNSSSTSQVTTKNYHALSLHHRVLAIRGLSELFANLNPSTLSQAQKQTIQATLYSLTFQSYYLSDLSGFFELLYFFRGCSILRSTCTTGGQDVGAEMCLEGDGDHWEHMETRLYDLPQVLNDDIKNAETSLIFARSLCKGNKMNWEFSKMLLAVVQEWKFSSLAAYFKFIQIYLAISKMSDYTFYRFIDGKNRVGRVLLAHFLAVQKIMGPILNREIEFDTGSGDGGLQVAEGIRGHKNWVEGIWDELVEDKSREWEALMEWPRRIFSQ